MYFTSKSINIGATKKIKDSVSSLKTSKARKRAYVNFLAINALIDYLKDNQISASFDCFDKSIIFLDEYDVANLNAENSIIDVRVVIGDEYPQMWVPKAHRNLGLLPDFYVGIKIDKSLSQANIVGYIEPKKLGSWSENKNYFIIESSSLIPIEEIKQAIFSINHNKKLFTSKEHNNVKSLFLAFIDNKLPEQQKNYLINHLLYCETCRNEFYNFYNLNKKLFLANKESLIREFKSTPELKPELKNETNINPMIAPVILASPILAPLNLNLPTMLAVSDMIGQIEDVSLRNAESSESVGINDEQVQENNIQKDEIIDHFEEDYSHEQDIKAEIQTNDNNNFEIIEENNLEEVVESSSAEIKNLEESKTEDVIVQDDSTRVNKPESKELNKTNLNEINDMSSNDYTISEEDLDYIIPSIRDLLYELPMLELDQDFSALNKTEITCDEAFICEINISEDPDKEILSEISNIKLGQDLNTSDDNEVICDEGFVCKLDISENLDNLNKSEIIVDEDIKNIINNLDSVEVVESFEAYTKLTEPASTDKEESISSGSLLQENQLADGNTLNNNYQYASNYNVNGDNFEDDQSSTLEMIIEDHPRELLAEKFFKQNMVLKIVMACSFVAIILLIGASFFYPKNSSNNPNPVISQQLPNPLNSKPISSEITKNNKDSTPPPEVKPKLAPPKLPKKVNNDNSAGKAFTSSGESVKVRNVSWEVGVSLASNNTFKNYLLITGQALKMTLEKNLLAATQGIKNNQIKIKLALDTSGNLKISQIKSGSGSEEVDKIIMQSVKDTILLTKMPKIQTNKNYIFAELIINL